MSKKVFIIHGWTYNLNRWQQLKKALLKRGVKPVFLKVPGLTASSSEVWDVAAYIAWLREAIGTEKSPIVIGHSNGGRIALNYAASYPKHIARLILIDSAGVHHRGILISTKRAVFKLAATIGKVLSTSPKLRRLLYKLAREKDYEQAPENMRRTMAHMLESDRQLDFSKITTPIDIIWGALDTVTPPGDAYILEHKLPHATAPHWIKEGRHSPFDTHPEEVADRIKELIS